MYDTTKTSVSNTKEGTISVDNSTKEGTKKEYCCRYILPPTERFISYRKNILQITQPSLYRCTQLQYIFAVISEAPSTFQLQFSAEKN